jgi:hypothetical protein
MGRVFRNLYSRCSIPIALVMDLMTVPIFLWSKEKPPGSGGLSNRTYQGLPITRFCGRLYFAGMLSNFPDPSS